MPDVYAMCAPCPSPALVYRPSNSTYHEIYGSGVQLNVAEILGMWLEWALYFFMEEVWDKGREADDLRAPGVGWTANRISARSLPSS